MSDYRIVYSDSLAHHGIIGQKWGQRNGPPYPLDSEDHSAREKKAGWRKSLNGGSETGKKKPKKTTSNVSKKSTTKSGVNTKNDAEFRSRITKSNNKIPNSKIAQMFNCSDEDAEKIKKAAIIAGISLATAAGAYIAYSYYKNNPEAFESLTSKVKEAGTKLSDLTNTKATIAGIKAEQGILTDGYNITSSNKPYDILSDNIMDGVDDGVGGWARRAGFGEVTGENLLNSSTGYFDPNDSEEVIRGVTVTLRAGDFNDRRLSCWSGSNAYYMTRMTGKDYCSKNFQNLVDFNSFDKLYTKPQSIYDISGASASDFVGKYGGRESRCSIKDSARFITNIFDNTTVNDGKPTIGFINAGYHDYTCTHQWNYEIEKNANGVKTLFMADSYTGKRYSVATQSTDGFINMHNLNHFAEEMGHYNASSVRFYKPELEDINLDTMSHAILGRIKDVKHMIEDYTGGYYAVTRSDYIAHHGIKGQRWGIRRFQNEDGSLTSSGRQRYDVGEARRAAVEGGLIGYARYRRTHQAPTSIDRERYKKEKLKDKQRKKKARIAKATQRDYELSKKMGLVKNRKEYDEAMKSGKKNAAEINTKAKKGSINVAEKALNVASLGVYGNIKKSESQYKEYVDKNGGPAMNSAAGLAVKGGLRYFSSAGTRLGVNLMKTVGATVASSIYMAAPSPAVKTGAMIAGHTLNAMGNVAIAMTDAYNVYGQARDTVSYVKKKTGK